MMDFHHHRLPDHSTLLAGRIPQDDTGFQSQHLQVWHNNTDKSWIGNGEAMHMHEDSDECFIVLKGALIVAVGGERYTIGPREFGCFPQGIFHSIVEVQTPVETFMIRAPSVDDKVYKDSPKAANPPR